MGPREGEAFARVHSKPEARPGGSSRGRLMRGGWGGATGAQRQHHLWRRRHGRVSRFRPKATSVFRRDPAPSESEKPGSRLEVPHHPTRVSRLLKVAVLCRSPRAGKPLLFTFCSPTAGQTCALGGQQVPRRQVPRSGFLLHGGAPQPRPRICMVCSAFEVPRSVALETRRCAQRGTREIH